MGVWISVNINDETREREAFFLERDKVGESSEVLGIKELKLRDIILTQ